MKKINICIILNDDRRIRCELYPEIAPITVDNFVNLIKNNYFNGTIFHRIIKGFMIQTGGYYLEDKKYLKQLDKCKAIKGEFKSNGFNNELKHTLGVISMARTNDKNSASSQFFICVANTPHLDGEYAAFGKVIDEESLKVAIDISKLETCTIGVIMRDFPCEDIEIKEIVFE